MRDPWSDCRTRPSAACAYKAPIRTASPQCPRTRPSHLHVFPPQQRQQPRLLVLHLVGQQRRVQHGVGDQLQRAGHAGLEAVDGVGHLEAGRRRARACTGLRPGCVHGRLAVAVTSNTTAAAAYGPHLLPRRVSHDVGADLLHLLHDAHRVAVPGRLEREQLQQRRAACYVPQCSMCMVTRASGEYTAGPPAPAARSPQPAVALDECPNQQHPSRTGAGGGLVHAAAVHVDAHAGRGALQVAGQHTSSAMHMHVAACSCASHHAHACACWPSKPSLP